MPWNNLEKMLKNIKIDGDKKWAELRQNFDVKDLMTIKNINSSLAISENSNKKSKISDSSTSKYEGNRKSLRESYAANMISVKSFR